MTEYRAIGRNEAHALPSEPFQARHFIDGEWHDSADGATFERRSPAHGDTVAIAARGGDREVGDAISAARIAFDKGEWPRMPGSERAAVLLRVADLIDRDRPAIAEREVLESGKPIGQAKVEIEGAADIWRYAASLARTQRGDSHNTLGPDMLGVVLRVPAGIASIITPWNFPFLIASQKLPFALAAGCTTVIKPSELTPGTTCMLLALMEEAGLPKGAANCVLGYADPVGETLTTDPRIDVVTFTGSTGVGKRIVAAAAPTLKTVALELGGKNPQVLFADADLDSAVDAIAFGAFFNAGECCNSGSRLIAHASIADEVTERVAALSRRVPMGDPLDPRTRVGAIVTAEHGRAIEAHVTAAAADGARVATGGSVVEVAGLGGTFHAPTVVSGVRPDMAIAREEVFGPVLSVLSFDTFKEGVALANDSAFGLSAGVWSESVHTCLAFAREARAGTVWTNTWMDGFPEMPFGGVGESGIGRELGRYGLETFLETKTVTMRIGRTRSPWIDDETIASAT